MQQKVWFNDSLLDIIKDYFLILCGALLQAISLRLFLVPASLASGGISGLSQIINHYTGFPIGVMVLIGNIPLFILGWRFLGGIKFAIRTAISVISFSFLADYLVPFLPANGITSDLFLNTLYGGLVSGVGYGLVYRGKATSGGSDILAKIINHWKGTSLSQSYLLTDTLVILLAGLTFNWERALYALALLYISGIAAETATQGVHAVRTVMIVTQEPQAVKEKILYELNRGVTIIPAQGGYSGRPITILYCVISRSEISLIKTFVKEADPNAFMVIGEAYEALGEGFKSLSD
jgi:uncharacterized membrane-anchored protein YitT (DUF2179 family)